MASASAQMTCHFMICDSKEITMQINHTSDTNLSGIQSLQPIVDIAAAATRCCMYCFHMRTYFRLWSSVGTTSNWVVTQDLIWSEGYEPCENCINRHYQDCLLFASSTWKLYQTLGLDFSLLGRLNRRSELILAFYGKNWFRINYSIVITVYKTLDRP